MSKSLVPPRIRDVADRAGVSVATVSRTLSRPEVVTQATRDAVMDAVAATGYRVNHAARNLRQQRSGMVVALVPNLANPFFSRILAGLGEALAEAGTGLIIADTRPGEDGARPGLEAFLNPTRCDGAVLFDGGVEAAHLTGRRGTPPLVVACEWIDGTALPSVTIDNAAGARLAVQHLASLGHKRIALIGGPAQNVLSRERDRGAREAALEARVTLTRIAGDFSIASGAAAAREWAALEPRPSAVLAFSDAMACGFLAEVQRAGLRVPQDVSVMGFDDIDIAPHLLPSLTTIHQPRRQIGRLAAETVLSLAAGTEPASRHHVLPVHLVVRESTGPAR
ncbi:LacI family DNA-binding transcriptional regulator [Paracoccus suum]|uniref:LacI family DNA-binding transcriptional regulator n=1 Tax=Paracoccus suum TaxID=2259340 RepID=A0A344PJM6_9RHOB|nr:LacI family DNA-binding transcriptional regulator [Paracoccus suum]AXC49581.1 LacI family DNA-binding transcriptional regulator [Paracoccus suum]